MNKITTQLNLFLVGFCMLVCVACQPTSTTITLFTPTIAQSTLVPVTATPKIVVSSTPTMDLLPTTHFIPTFTPEPTNTSTPLPTQTWTPLSTLSPDAAMMEVQRLYETNNGCLLPCWWGIVPGQTTWVSAQRFFESFVSRIIEPLIPPTGPLWGVEISLPTKEISAPHHYRIYNDVILDMEGYIEMTPLFDPTTILATYGPPTEIRFFFVRGGPYLELILFYPEYGFLLQYETRNGNTELVNGFQRGCIRPNGVTYIVVWSPAETFTLSERLSQTSHFHTDPNPGPPIEETLGMNIETFYQTFQNAELPMCLETPDNLWVGR